MKIIFLTVLFLNLTAFGQHQFRITNISKKYDIEIKAEKIDYGVWRGKTDVFLFRKSSAKPFQIIHLKDTQISLNDNGQPEVATVKDKENGKWSSVYLEDFNFDGSEDLAVADGDNGGYRGTSYRVYLYDRNKRKFIFSRSFTHLVQGPFIGIFEVDYKKKTLGVFWESGCCFHEEQKYRVVENRPMKIYEYSENAMIGDGNVYITTKKLIKGQWRSWNKTEKESVTKQKL